MKTADQKNPLNQMHDQPKFKKRLQPKLKLSQPGDPYEREADQVADRVMAMSGPAAEINRRTARISRLIQRQEEEEEMMQPDLLLMRQEEEEEMMQPDLLLMRQEEEEEEAQPKPWVMLQAEEEEEAIQPSKGSGRPPTESWISSRLQKGNSGNVLPKPTRNFMENRFGADFSKVRIHANQEAASMSHALQARAFTNRNHIYFNSGQYNPTTHSGRHLLAHELTHVIQQGGAGIKRQKISGISKSQGTDIHRSVSFDVTKWTAKKLGPPAITNGTDRRRMRIPPSGQVRIIGKVRINGAAGDNCSGHAIGTTQTAWSAWTRIQYRGRTARDGSVTLTHRPPMPMRDPADHNSVWYDAANVVNPVACGSEVQINHFDSPWHEFPKATPNDAVTGSPLNFLRSYERGLHLVTYLTVQDPSGSFMSRPLKYRYWNTQQRYTFTPQYPSPPTNAAFLGSWPSSGGVTVNTGSQGDGEVADAPHYETTGTEFNAHFNNSANWTRTENS